MTNELGTAVLTLRTDVRQLQGGLREAQNSLDSFGRTASSIEEKVSFTQLAVSMQAVADGAGRVGSSVSSAFGKADELIQASFDSAISVRTVFGESAEQVLKFGENAAETVGLSRKAFNELVTPMGAVLTNVTGLNDSDAAKWAIDLATRASDLAFVFNTDVSTAMEAINSGIQGQSEPLRQFGISISAVMVENKALAMTGKTSAEALTEEEKSLARLNLIMEQSSKVAGSYGDNQDLAYNKQQNLRAELENTRAEIGEKLLPVQTELLTQFAALPTILQIAGIGFMTFAGDIGSALFGVSQIGIGLSGLLKFKWTLLIGKLYATGVAMATAFWPVLVVAGIIAIVAALYIFRDDVLEIILQVWSFIKAHWETLALILAPITGPFMFLIFMFVLFRDEAVATFNAVVGAASWAGGAIVAAFNWVAGAATTAWGAIVGAVNWAAGAVSSVVNFIVGTVNWLAAQIGAAVNFIVENWRYAAAVFLILGGPIVWIGALLFSFIGGALYQLGIAIAGTFGFIKGVVESVVSAIGGAMSWLGGQIAAGATFIWNQLTSAFNSAAGIVSSVVSTLVNMVSSAFNWLAGQIASAVSFIWNQVTSAFNSVWNTVRPVVDTMVNVIVGAFNWLKDQAISAVNILTDSVISTFNWLRDRAREIFDSVSRAVSDAMNWAKDRAIEAAQILLDSVIFIIDDLPDLLWQIGRNAVTEIGDGMKDGFQGLKDVVGEIIGIVPDFIRDALGIGSPSKVMFDIGKNIVEGLANGIKDKTSDIISSVGGLAGGLLGGFGGLIGGLGGAIGGLFASGGNLGNVGQWSDLVGMFFPKLEVPRALAVMNLESGGNPLARKNDAIEDSVGLFQINTRVHPVSPGQMYNPVANVAYAAQLWRAQGWSPWTAARILGFAAQGLTNAAKGLYVVGERGPELVELPRGANVYPNSAMGATAQQGVQVVVNGDVNISDPRKTTGPIGDFGWAIKKAASTA